MNKVDVTLDAPDEAPAATSVDITWASGPDAPNDQIAVTEIGKKKVISFAYTRNGNTVSVQMPVKPGDYEIHYLLNQKKTILVTRPITVTPIEVTLDAPDEASLGETISVNWLGPDEKADAIAVVKVGEKSSITRHSAYTRDGNPLDIQLPKEPGEYEIRYVLCTGRTTLATRPPTLR